MPRWSPFERSTTAGLDCLNASGEVEWTQTHPFRSGAVRGLVLTEDGAVIATGYTHAEEEGFLFIAEEAKAFLAGRQRW